MVLIASNAVAQSQLVKKTEVEGITEYNLENGVKLLLFPDNSKPQFTMNMTVMVGSRHEGYGESGMAHLLEHMLFRGSDLHPDIPKLLKDRGVLNMNGTTSIDRTNYFETLPATDENLKFAIEMESDRLINSWIRADHLEKEMTVVRSEFERSENSPQSILYQRLMTAAYQWHNYGKSTIGNRSDIMRVPADNLRVFYKKYYQPDNITGRSLGPSVSFPGLILRNRLRMENAMLFCVVPATCNWSERLISWLLFSPTRPPVRCTKRWWKPSWRPMSAPLRELAMTLGC